MAASNEMGYNTEPNFAFLPDTAWVKILQNLSLVDQYHLSLTCHRLHGLFYHPSLWQTAELYLVGGLTNFVISETEMPNRFKKIVQNFGHLFRHLTIHLSGHLVTMESNTQEILATMAQVCRLECLVLEVGIMTSDLHRRGFRPFEEGLKEILKLVESAYRLKKLEVVSWPMYPEIMSRLDLNVFEVVKKNTKLDNLESLSLFWMRDKQWSERSPILPDSTYTKALVSHFKSLRHLDLRSPMLSDELLNELASTYRMPLSSLRILIMYSSQDMRYRIPFLSPSSWKRLKDSSPELEVECTIMSRIPEVELAGLLVPEIPLVAFNVLKFSTCTPQMLQALKEKFHQTLRSFVCYHDPQDCEVMLMDMVAACPHIHSLVFHGQIHSRNITDLIKMHRNWKTFEFVKSQVMTKESEINFDENTVIGRTAAGELVQVDFARFHSEESEEEHEKALEDLSKFVSQRLGYRWCLIDTRLD